MTTALKLLCRVIQRRLDNGEELNQILNSYPRLTDSQRNELKQHFSA